MDVKKKLVEIMSDLGCNAEYCEDCEFCNDIDGCVRRQKEIIADRLIAHGGTVQEWILPEQDYYVLRNTETGMYFRGKGVNRWGKHFNQATIYRVKGTAEHSIKEVAWHGETAELVRIKIVELPQLRGENGR